MTDAAGWERDPELRALRDEFIGSLPRRLAGLKLPSPTGGLELEARAEVHRLAGVAGSYGFPTLSRIAGAVDDALELPGVAQGCLKGGGTLIQVLARALRRGVSQAYSTRTDPGPVGEEPEVAEAISVVESLVREPSRGSS